MDGNSKRDERRAFHLLFIPRLALLQQLSKLFAIIALSNTWLRHTLHVSFETVRAAMYQISCAEKRQRKQKSVV